MTVKIGINGFGRIGRLVARALSEYSIDDVELVAINSPGAVEVSAHLLRYDSVHGRFASVVTEGNGFIEYDGKRVRMSHERDPADINWGALDVSMWFWNVQAYSARAKQYRAICRRARRKF